MPSAAQLPRDGEDAPTDQRSSKSNIMSCSMVLLLSGRVGRRWTKLLGASSTFTPSAGAHCSSSSFDQLEREHRLPERHSTQDGAAGG